MSLNRNATARETNFVDNGLWVKPHYRQRRASPDRRSGETLTRDTVFFIYDESTEEKIKNLGNHPAPWGWKGAGCVFIGVFRGCRGYSIGIPL